MRLNEPKIQSGCRGEKRAIARPSNGIRKNIAKQLIEKAKLRLFSFPFPHSRSVMEEAHREGRTWREVKRLAADRSRWKSFVDALRSYTGDNRKL
jgi:hypothetical protein